MYKRQRHCRDIEERNYPQILSNTLNPSTPSNTPNPGAPRSPPPRRPPPRGPPPHQPPSNPLNIISMRTYSARIISQFISDLILTSGDPEQLQRHSLDIALNLMAQIKASNPHSLRSIAEAIDDITGRSEAMKQRQLIKIMEDAIAPKSGSFVSEQSHRISMIMV